MNPTTDPWIGRRLGRYLLREKLGGGGGGAVYAAWDETLEREVALKVLVPLPGASPEMMERFQQEAKLTARMNHPNIVPIYDVGDEGGVYYIAMRRLPGRTLGDLLSEKGTLSQAEAINVTLPVAEALAYAHQRGIVHRDLKPANVLFDDENRPMLVDFGIAKTLDPHDQRLTMTGTTIGTPPYMSPEQAAGEALDHRSDIYSLGILLYQMVTGRPPFQGSALAVMQAHLNEPPTPPRALRPDLGPELEKVILKAIAKRPADRFGSVGELIEALRAVQRGQPTRIYLPPTSAIGATGGAPTRAMEQRPASAAPAAPYPREVARGTAPPPRRPAPPPAPAASGGFPFWTLTVFLLFLLCAAGAAVAAGLYLPDLATPDLGGGGGEPAGATATVPLPVVVAPTESPSPTEPPPGPTETPAPTETGVPTGTPTEVPTETPEPTATEAPTETPEPTATEEPTITPTPGCSAPINGIFADDFYDRALMGCPLDAAYQLNGSYQQFEGGFMVYDASTDLIYVFFEQAARWARFEDEWGEDDDQDEEFACEAAEEAGGPVRGFGIVWCDNEIVRETLGAPVTGEIINPLTFQPAEDALLINVPARATRLALFDDQSYIER